MSLTGAMANGDQRLPVPGHPGVNVQAAAETDVDAALIAEVLRHPGPVTDTGITARSEDVFASLRPWLAFREPALATLTYSGPPDAADASAVPAVIDFTVRGVTRRASPCLPGPAGLAVLDVSSLDASDPDASAPDGSDPDASDPDGTSGGDPDGGRMLQLTVRGYGEARQQTARLMELIMAWDAASRPGTDRLRIDAYPSGIVPQDTRGVPQLDAGGIVAGDTSGIVPRDTGGIVHVTPHATFVISSSRA
ncbi:MAG: hypothetical protein ACRDND_20205 [Streptosporangiaceae bacterium]